MGKLGLLNKSKSFNRRGRKGKTQSSQRAEFMRLSFAFSATSLRSLRLKRTFSTILMTGDPNGSTLRKTRGGL